MPWHIHDPERDEQLKWTVPCAEETPDDRADGHLDVLVLGDRVALVLPSGETLMFTAEEADTFAAALGRVAGHASLDD